MSGLAPLLKARVDDAPSAPVPSRRARVRLALIAGACSVVATYLAQLYAELGFPYDRLGADFTFWWRAARALLIGQNPYLVIQPTGPFPFDGVFAYPLTAALAAIPFAGLTARLGASLFVGCGFALAAYGLSAQGTWRVAVLVSAPAFWVFDNAQWTPLLLGATLVPAFGWLLACKPTIGAALFAWRPTWAAVIGGVAFLGLATLVLPSWPLDWLASVRANGDRSQYAPPVMLSGGAILLLVLARWRRPEARLVAVLSCVPQNYFFYDQLPLLLVPARQGSLLVFALWTHLLRLLAFNVLQLSTPENWGMSVSLRSTWLAPFILWGMYIPCVLMILRRPNEGYVPPRLYRMLVKLHLPRILLGRSQGSVMSEE
jgi:hypothetical protein